jgi:hypothetical protein
MRKNEEEKIIEELQQINKKLSILITVILARIGMSSIQIGKILDLDDSTIRRLVPNLKKIKRYKGGKNEKE